MSNNDEWMTIRATQNYLHRGDRMIRKYVAAGRIRTRVRGRRVEYLRADVEALATELEPETREQIPEQAIVPPGELLNHIKDLERQLNEATAQIGYLRGLLEERNIQLEEAKAVRRLLTDKEQEAVQLHQQLTIIQGGRRIAWATAAFILIIFLLILAYFLTR
jgi:hypothetical protein